MIDCLVNYYADGNQAEFSRMLGLRPQSISEWKKRDRIDLRLVYQCCKDVSADWLLSDGQGEMIRGMEPPEPTRRWRMRSNISRLCSRRRSGSSASFSAKKHPKIHRKHSPDLPHVFPHIHKMRMSVPIIR